MKYLNALNKMPFLGPKKFKLLSSFFENWEKVWQANFEDLLKSGLDEKTVQKIIEAKKKIDPEKNWEELEKNNIQILTQEDDSFPNILKETKNSPFLLYQRGKLNLNFHNFISIVGSRKSTHYGRQVTQKIAQELTQAGLIVVSGLALGIDALAHESALSSDGKTVAVLGSSLDNNNIYPRHNFHLAQRIEKSGCLLSEYAPQTSANKLTFPIRNRIIAGLSLGTVIIEAAQKSGSLITASLALEENREVFSIPGEIFSPQSVGTNKLIQEGAKMITCAQDILEEINIPYPKEKKVKKEIIPKNENEKKIISILSHEPLHVDKIAQITKLETTIVSSALSLMEINGWIKNIGGQNYILL